MESVSVKEGEDGMFTAEVELSCPVCYELAILPYGSNCGHLCCKKCANQVKKCPVCQNDKPNWTFNHYIDRIVRNVSRPCRYDHCGCKYTGSATELAEHVKTCKHKPKKVATTLKKHAKPRVKAAPRARVVQRGLRDLV